MNSILSLHREVPVDIRAVHLDFKGMPPTFSRLLRLLDIFRVAGFNALLLEWEDAFPWTVDPAFRSPTAFTRQQVADFYQKAQSLGFELIPLVQTIGHMETPLRSKKYAHLREVAENSDVLNVLARGADELVRAMVDDVLTATPNCRFFHLGGDEAITFGQHPDTRAYIQAHSQATLYSHHIEPLCDHLLAQGVRPILWHDMMLTWSRADLAALGAKADLCIWAYQRAADIPWHFSMPDDVEDDLPLIFGGGQVVHGGTFKRFLASGVKLWGAGAYKLSEGRDNADLPVFHMRMLNARDWLTYSRAFPLQGLIATGWSRNCSDNVQYVPIDAALDTLMACGSTWATPGEAHCQREACLSRLEELGERQVYQAVADLMQRLTQRRDGGWSVVVRLRELLALAENEPYRRVGGWANRHLVWLKDHCDKGDELLAQALMVFAPLVEPIWVKHYFQERLGALRTEFADLQVRVETRKKME